MMKAAALLLTIFFLGVAACRKEEGDTYHPPRGVTYAITVAGWQLAGSPIQFSSNADPADYFLWNFGDGTTSSEPNPIHTYTNPDLYKVTLIVNDDTAHRSVLELPVASTLNFFYDGSRVAGDSMHFFLLQPAPAGTTFLWKFGDGAISTAENAYHIYSTPGTYSIKLTLNGTQVVPSEHYSTVNIISDPLYTRDMLGTRLWHVVKHEQIINTGVNIDTTYAYDESITLYMIDKLRIYPSQNTVSSAGALFYDAAQSRPGFMVFGDGGGAASGVKLSYDHAADTMRLEANYAEVGNHNNPAYRHYMRVVARTP